MSASREEDFKRNNTFSPYDFMTYMPMPQHKRPCPVGHEIYNFCRTFLGHHYYILSLSDLYLGVAMTGKICIFRKEPICFISNER